MELTHYFESRGVEMCEVVGGLRTPARFSDPETEHMATRRAAGMFDFSFMGCVELTGPEAVRVLESVQTRHIADLPVGQIRYTLLLRDDGTVLNDATVWRTAEASWLIFVGRRRDLRGATDLAGAAARTVNFAVIALQGPRAAALIARVVQIAGGLRYFGFTGSQFAGSQCLVARIGYSGEPGYEIVVAPERAAELWQALRAAGATECGFTAVNTLRIEAGHILFSNELAVRVTPAELACERLVHGRASRLRAPQRRLCGFMLDGPVETPTALDLDQVRAEHAIVTSACPSPLLGRWIGIGFVSDECRYAGTRVQVAPNARATVARLPFYDPMKRRVR